VSAIDRPVSIAWDQILNEIRAIALRNEIVLEEVPAPQKLAPHALALTADVDIDVATGRFVLLHDPQGQDGQNKRNAHVSRACRDEGCIRPFHRRAGGRGMTTLICGDCESEPCRCAR